MNERTLSSPNRMVWQFSACLRRLAYSVRSQEEGNNRRQDIALTIILAITVVESFVNMWFRVLIEQPANEDKRATVLKDLARRASLDHKVKTWPQLLFGRSWDVESEAAKRFADLKAKRNELMHFTSSYETMCDIPRVVFHGLADTGVFDSLSVADADLAVSVAEEAICALLMLSGQTTEQAELGLHHWTGRVPSRFLNPPTDGGPTTT